LFSTTAITTTLLDDIEEDHPTATGEPLQEVFYGKNYEVSKSS